jgi:hypothetical protein
MNATNFEVWLRTKLIPNLPPNSVSGFGQRLVSQHCGSQRAYKRIDEVSDDRIFVQEKHSI